jgi:putative membrane protein
MLTPALKKNDKQAKTLIIIFSIVLTAAIALLDNPKFQLTGLDLGFNVHIFATINAVINSAVSVLLIWALIAVKNKKFELHKNIMLTAMALSILFLLSYVAHHLFAGSTKFGGTGGIRYFYLILLATHILLVAVTLPFILFTAYRSLTGEYEKHKKLAKYTWPLWLYISITGVIVYLLISPYYV